MNKKQVSREVFDKQVEIEAAHLMYMNNMSKAKADKAAQEIVSELYEVV